MENCSECGGPKGGIGIPLYGDPRCMSCLRKADKAEAEARGEKYERWHCTFGYERKVGGASCTGTNWEWTRDQIVDGLACRVGHDMHKDCWNRAKRYDWVRVDGPGMSIRFTRQKMPGAIWGDVIVPHMLKFNQPLPWVQKILAALRGEGAGRSR